MPQQNTNISLYHESQAKDNCGFGLIVNRHGTQNRDVVKRSIAGLTSMTHRGLEESQEFYWCYKKLPPFQ